MKKIVLVVILLAVSSLCFAETIIFKSRQTVDAKIIERTNKYIKVDVDGNGTILTYPLEQVESINGERIESIPGINPAVQESLVSSDSGLDTNYTEFNIFKIKLPRGWKVSQKFDRSGGLIIIIGPNPQTSFSISYLSSDRNAPDIFKENIIKEHEDDIRQSLKKQGVVLNEELTKTKTIFQNVPALRFDIYILEQNQRFSGLFFIKEGHTFTISVGTNISESDLYKNTINDSLNTFELFPKTQQQANQRNKTVNVIDAFKQGFSGGRIKANEDVTLKLCGVYARTLEVYKERNQNYPASFRELDNKGYLSSSDPYNRLILQSKPAQGYYYSYYYINKNHFILEAKPAQQGVTGIRTFRVDETGVVKTLE